MLPSIAFDAPDWTKMANLDATGVTEPPTNATVFIERTWEDVSTR